MSKRENIRLYLTAAIAILIAGVFFSYARGAWLALAAGMLSYWLIKKRLLVIAYVTFIIITVAGVFWLKNNDRYLQYAHDYQTTIFHTNFNEHFIATYTLKDVSTAERFYRWIAGVRMLKDGGLTGYGPGTFYNNYKSYTIPAYKTWVSHNPEHSTVHNYFLLVAIEQGLPGLFFWLLLAGALLYYAQRLYHRVADIYYKIVAITSGVILTMIMILNLLSDLIETDKIGSLFFLCLALLIATDVNTRRRSELSPDVESIP
ncbi:MAG: O-antigen ligase family protein [Chitinophagaceae bacterium]|nr:O-antigen ligase family protein [Chitinophagaceae bacterium]